MLNIESKISGWSISGYGHLELLFDSQFITLDECAEKVQKQETMNYILDTLRFSKGQNARGEKVWFCTMDYDTIYKLTILDKYPHLASELVEYFGGNWLNLYLRFGH